MQRAHCTGGGAPPACVDRRASAACHSGYRSRSGPRRAAQGRGARPANGKARRVRYNSFLLRLWRGSRHGRPQWSARLEGLQDGRRVQFGSADDLLAHLQALLAADPPGGPDPPQARLHPAPTWTSRRRGADRKPRGWDGVGAGIGRRKDTRVSAIASIIAGIHAVGPHRRRGRRAGEIQHPVAMTASAARPGRSGQAARRVWPAGQSARRNRP